jgi:hypothetical protein
MEYVNTHRWRRRRRRRVISAALGSVAAGLDLKLPALDCVCQDVHVVSLFAVNLI